MRLRRGTLLISIPPIDQQLLQVKQNHLSVSIRSPSVYRTHMTIYPTIFNNN
jgi:hypothetical protein